MTNPHHTAFACGTVIRVVNYHNTPASRADQIDAEFAALAARYAPVTEDDLDRYIRTGAWQGDRPGILLSFYNGYRNNYDIALPALEKHGLVGWLFAVPGYSSCPPADQLAFGNARTLKTIPNEYEDGRLALSWDELRDMDARGHVVASHTRTHTPVALDDNHKLQTEILGAQDDFMDQLGHPVRAFAWLSGGRYGENPAADRFVDSAGYDFLFSNFAIQRLPNGRGAQAE